MKKYWVLYKEKVRQSKAIYYPYHKWASGIDINNTFLNPSLREGAGCIKFDGFWQLIGGENEKDDEKYWGTETFLISDKKSDTGYLPVLPTSINVSKEKL